MDGNGMTNKIFPKQNSLVVAEVAKITRYGAYCKLPEYGNTEVFLPLKEVSSGWIKNIREFLHQGQKVVCKVIYVDIDKDTVDISLKKVTAKESKTKISEYNLEKRLNGLFMQALKISKEDQQSKDQTIQYIMGTFQNYTNLFFNAANDTEEYKKLQIPKKLRDAITSLIAINKKKKRHNVSYVATIYTFNTKSGMSTINELLKKVEKKGVNVSYISSPKYKMTSEGQDYNEAENKIKGAVSLIESTKGIIFKIEKEKLKKEKENVMDAIYG